QLFVNVRTDGFLLGMPNALTETLSRIEVYENSGADGIFVPCITNRSDIREVVNAIKLPVNVMCMPALPDFDELASLGVKRISMGPFLFNQTNNTIKKLATTILEEKNFSSVL
ncbi:MAG TPA: isocitrate lyase/phosphoenolpyruvate mutase family protein, partial [Mucilaginibacter sp.]|nr:isocitrate lyase/phosphoenolpyruvate mutase family protein [Mucilaginibacter sp.]